MSGSKAPLSLNFSNEWRWMLSLIPWPSYTREKANGSQWTGEWLSPGSVWTFSIREKISYSCRNSKSGPSSLQPSHYVIPAAFSSEAFTIKNMETRGILLLDVRNLLSRTRLMKRTQ